MTAAPSGVLLIDKPSGWTSHDVVARVRKLAATRKVGHAGTLDPMATGVLVIGVGSATRLLTFVVGADKEYIATVRLGQQTTTDDAEGEILHSASDAAVAAVTSEHLASAVARLTGELEQVPSSVSAIKVDGKRAYARVRSGEDVHLKPRHVTVESFEILGLPRPSTGENRTTLDVDVRVECSSGTYIRALARDLGADLGVGGHLTALRRTRVGPFRIDDAAPLDALDVAAQLLTPASVAVRLFPRLDLSDEQATDLGHGKKLDRAAVGMPSDPRGPLAALDPAGRLIGLAEVRGDTLTSVVNFPPDSLSETGTV